MGKYKKSTADLTFAHSWNNLDISNASDRIASLELILLMVVYYLLSHRKIVK